MPVRALSHRGRPRASLLLALAAVGCLPPAPPTPTGPPATESVVRVHARGAGASTGRLVQLAPDSVRWRPDGAGGAVRALPLGAVARIEVREPLSQRDALKRGLVRGGLAGAALGGVLLAVRRDAVGGAVALTLGSAWVVGVISGQQVESPQPPTRWRTVHP
jgi:hypothetical protein